MKLSRIASSLLLCVATFSVAHAKPGDHELAREALKRGEIRPLSNVMQAVSAQIEGEIIEVELKRRKHGQWIYEFKFLDNEGRIKKAEVDADTKEILKIKDKPEKPHAPPHR